MSLKSQEIARGLELSVYAGLIVSTGIINGLDISSDVRDGVMFGKNIALNLYTLDFMTALWRERLTDQYDKLQETYKLVIESTCGFMSKLGLVHPIEVFATYIYLYRNNYLSYGTTIKYNNDLKDIGGLQGIDVIRGNVLCRSLACMLNDIYRGMKYNTKTIPIKASSEALNKGCSLNNVELACDENNKCFSFPWGANHLINMVENNGKNYIVDPTNDLFLLYKNNHITLANMVEEEFKYYPLNWLFSNLVGIHNQGINLKSFMKQLKMPSISFEEYCYLYQTAIKKLEENQLKLANFGESTNGAMEKINYWSDEIDSCLKRLIPLFPNRGKNNN